ncbi:MAG: HYExAFE family protein [Planctomycetota bacterium]
MGRRHIHYEAAFEDLLRASGWPHLTIDERRKAIFHGTRVKTFDFVVYPPQGPAWLVDVKGRKFPYQGRNGKRFWENWVTRDDLVALRQWGEVFGPKFQPVFIFMYWLVGSASRDPTTYTHAFRGEFYSCFSIPVADYAAHARPRSDKWQTLSMPTREFRRLANPINPLIREHSTPAAQLCGGVGPALQVT